MTKQLCVSVFCLFAILASSATANGEDKNSKAKDPGKFFFDADKVSCFVHMRLGQLASASQMNLAKQLVGNVEKELDRLFHHHLGFKTSQVESFTYVVPGDAALEETGRASLGLLMIKFAGSSGLPELEKNKNWKFSKFKGRRLYTSEDGVTICAENKQRVLVGETQDVKWFLKNSTPDQRSQADFGSYKGQVVLGFNVGKSVSSLDYVIPENVFAIVPARNAIASIQFDRDMELDVELRFDSDRDANNSLVVLESLVSSGKKFLKQQAKDTSRDFESDFGDLEFALEKLAMLSLIRQGEKVLDKIELKKDSRRLIGNVELKGVDCNLLLVAGLTAIQELGGAQAEAQFDNIADQLE